MKKSSTFYAGVAEDVASFYPVPIPLKDVIEDEGIKLICDDYGTNTFDGLTIYERNEEVFYIHLNITRGNRIDNNKGRFTLAHELGHYFIDEHRNAMVKGVMRPHWHKYNPFGNNEVWEIEREADCFAANLLMPLGSFKQSVQGFQFNGELINTLSQKYKVSFNAIALRYMKLNYVPIMLVYAESGIIKWQMHSDDFPFYRLKYDKVKVPEQSVMGEYFLTGSINNCRKDEIVFAGDCFMTFNLDQNNIQFYEYCIPYQNKVLSMFWQKD